MVDWFWYVLVAPSLVGVVAAFARRNRLATSLLPMPLALAALYTLFFAEARYHLAIAILLMPFAGAGLVWVGEAVRDLARFTIDRQRRPRLPIEGVVAGVGDRAAVRRLAADAGGGGAPARAAPLGGRGVQRRGGAAACARSARRCRRPGRASRRCAASGTASGFASRRPAVAAATDIDLPAGKYRVSMRVEAAGDVSPTAPRSALSAGGVEIRRTPWPAPGSTVALVASGHARRR